MKQGTASSCLFVFLVLVLTLPVTPVFAEGKTPHEELYQLLEIDPEIQPYSTDLFGDRIDMATGSLSFEQVDVSLRGSFAIPVEIRRTFTVGGMNGAPHEPGLTADWTLEIPRIRTLVAKESLYSDGSLASVEPHWRETRCEDLGTSVRRGRSETYMGTFMPEEFWHGYFVDIPSGGGEILRKTASNEIPTPTPGDYNWTTKNNIMIRCLSNISTDGAGNPNVNPSGHPLGQGFQALTPDGTLYTFDRLVYRHAGTVDKTENEKPLLMTRYSAEMQVSRIEDRFGNWVEYEYNSANRPIRIVASDGRTIAISYNADNLVSTVRVIDGDVETSNNRTWTYSYDFSTSVPILDSVTRPDGNKWEFSLRGLAFQKLKMDTTLMECGNPTTAIGGSATGSMTHPLGAEAQFSVAPKRHNRVTDVACFDSMNRFPPFVFLTSIVSKQVTGAGFADMRWEYDYSENLTPYADRDDAPAITEKWVDVKTPEGNVVRHYASMDHNWHENTPTRTVYFKSGFDPCVTRSTACNTYSFSNVLREVTMEHVAGPQRGITPHFMRMAIGMVQIPRLKKQTIREGSTTFTREVLKYDVHDMPLEEVHYSSTNSRRKHIDYVYQNNAGEYSVSHLWKKTVSSASTSESAVVWNVFDWSEEDELPEGIKSFGAVLGEYTYQSDSLLSTYTDAMGNTATYRFYKRGIPGTIEYPDGMTKHFAVDGHGQITGITDQRKYTTSYGYDNMGRVKEIDYPDNDTTAWTTTQYDFQPNVHDYGLPHRRLITTGSNQVQVYFDALLRPVLTVQRDTSTNERRFTRRRFDSDNRTTFVSYPSASSSASAGTHSSYDSLGRLTSQTVDSELGPLTTSFTYTNGNRRTVTDPRGNSTSYVYEAYSSPDYSLPTRIEAPEGQLTQIDYDLFGNMIQVTQSGGGVAVQRDYIYDGQKRLCRRVDPETGNSVWQYDAAGRVTWYAEGIPGSLSGCGHASVPAELQRKLSYDAMSRVVTDDIPGAAHEIGYTYDDAGNVIGISSSAADWTYVLNARNLPVSETLTVDTETVSFTYDYNARGQLSSITYPSGRNVGLAPNAYGEPTQVGHLIAGIERSPNGSPSTWLYANGVWYNAEQNARQLPKRILHSGVTGYDYMYDANANITDMVALNLNGTILNNIHMQYDALNRLIQADGDLWGQASYAYDPLGNLAYKAFDDFGVSTLVPPREQVYEYDTITHRLTGILDGSGTGTYTHRFTYDDKGNIVSTGSDSFIFDHASRMTQATGKASYGYDGHGRRVKVTDSGSGAVRYMAYTKDGLLRYEHDVASGEKTEYYYLDRTLIAKGTGAPDVPVVGSFTADTNPNDGSFTLSWSSPSETSFMLYERAPGASSWTTLLDRSSATSITLNDRNGGTWRYRLAACNSAEGCSFQNAELSVGVTPAKPVITVPGGGQNGAYTVSWSKPASTTAFTVQEYDGATWRTLLSNTTATSVVRNPASGGTYRYQVKAINGYGDRGYAVSADVGVLPKAPGSVTVPSQSTNGNVSVSWGASVSATSYTLVRQRYYSGSWHSTGSWTVSGTGKSFTSHPDGTHRYRVRGCNSHGCGSYKTSSSLLVEYPPATPGGLTAPTSSETDMFDVSWNPVGNAVSYDLQQQYQGGSWSTIRNNITQTSTSIYVTRNGTYGFRVRANRTITVSPWSAVKETFVFIRDCTYSTSDPASTESTTTEGNTSTDSGTTDAEALEPSPSPSTATTDDATTQAVPGC